MENFEAAVIRSRTSAYCFATWDLVFITIWRLSSTEASFVEMNRVAREFIAAGPRRVSYLSIVEGSAPPPPDVARDELARFSRDVVPQMAVAVIVAEGGGFRASFVRGVGIALTMLMPHKVPFKFAGSVQQGAVWIAPHLSPGSGGAVALDRAVEDLRAKIAVPQSPFRALVAR